ncbi:addiction module toxin, GnsA/GnsB family [Escherichia coli]|nr:addiction module toxin, GnsA/GnsB family [Escherichia coli]
MNIEDLKTKAEADISEYITKKLLNLRKRPGKKLQYSVYRTGKNDGS